MKNKKLYVEHAEQFYIPDVQAYFAGVFLNGSTVDLRYHVYSVFTDVVEGDYVTVDINGGYAGSGQLTRDGCCNLQLIISGIPLEKYRTRIMGSSYTLLDFTVLGVAVELLPMPYYWYL